MLRPKQITSLSSCARSLLYSGSKCSTADGSSPSCSCPEDGKRTSSTFSKNGKVPHPTAPALESKGSHKPDNIKQSAPVTQVASSTVPGARPNNVHSFAVMDSDQNDSASLSSPNITDRLVKASLTTAVLLSDLMNYKLPSLDGSGVLTQAQNYMVRPSRPQPGIKIGNLQTAKQVLVHTASEKSSSNKEGVVTPVTSRSFKGKNNMTGNSTPHQREFNNPKSICVETHVETETRNLEKRPCVPQRGKVNKNNFPVPLNYNLERLGTQWGRSASRHFTSHSGSSLSAKQHMNTGEIVGVILDILNRLKWGPPAVSALENIGVSMDAYQANQVLKQIQDHSVALAFFRWLKTRHGFKHDGHTYTTMIGTLGRSRQFDEINSLLIEMVKDGCQPNVVTYNRLIHSYGRANYLNKALEVFHQMQELGCEPDRVTYCTLIDIHAKAGFLDVAMYMYRRMQEAGLSPDTFTYSVMINCLGKAGDLAASHRLFCEMAERGCTPNVVTYNIMIALQAKTRNYPVALQIYRDMQNAGYEPDKVTYNIVMEVLGHCGYLEEAEGLFSDMRRKNWVPDEPVYGLLVDLWGKAGNPDKALGWYQAMLDDGLLPNVPTCNSLLSAFLRVHRLKDAYSLLVTMIQMGLSPSLQTYTLLLSCCTEAKSSSDMWFCCRLMAISGHPAHLFLQTMPSAGPDGSNVRAHMGRFLDSVHSEDRESKRGLVDAVVDFLHKSGLKEEAGSVWEVAAERNVYPEALREKGPCYWLINLHVMSDGTAVIALSRTLAWFRRQMMESGVVPDRIDIVTGWGRRSRVTGASLVRQSVQKLLDVFSFPFAADNGNSGCFVGCGEALNRWLLQSYIERMHLL